MDKISGIIPQTPRTASKRFTDNTPVRPGAPQFGRPEGSSEIKDRVSITNAQSTELKPYRNPRDAAHVKIVDDLSRKFFLTPANQPSVKTALADTDADELSLPDRELSMDSNSINVANDSQE